jgi:hypothetical protein
LTAISSIVVRVPSIVENVCVLPPAPSPSKSTSACSEPSEAGEWLAISVVEVATAAVPTTQVDGAQMLTPPTG